MSHNFKRPAPHTPEQHEQAEVRRLARIIPDQKTLDAILAASQPHLRNAVLKQLKPYLSFVPGGE